MENVLARLYNELAVKIISMIPASWEEIHYLGEVSAEKTSCSSVFYFRESETGEFIKSHEIPKRYHVSRGIYNELMQEEDQILLKIYDVFLKNHQEPWDQLRLSLNRNGDFDINYMYHMQDDKFGQVKREVIWAYEAFDFIPKEGTYSRQVLDQYLEEQQG